MLGLFVAKVKPKNEVRVLTYLEHYGIEARSPKINVLKADRQFAAQQPGAPEATDKMLRPAGG